MTVLEYLFWICCAFIVYTYFGYPLLLKVVSLFRTGKTDKRPIIPSVGFIIAAYNEEKSIRNKIENTLALDYPADKLEIIIASDCSNDRTDDIVTGFAGKGVRLVRATERRGKEYAQNLAVEKAKGEILVFSDVGAILERDALRNIVYNFSDAGIGAVSSVDKILSDDGRVTGENFYVRYEMMLRELETRVGSVVGLSGSFFAVRREVCRGWQEGLPGDFNAVIHSIKLGLRAISDPEAIGYYRNVRSERQEWLRKIRTVVGGISVIMGHREILNPFKYGFFSLQALSHKIFRWLIPFALLAALLLNLFLAYHTLFYAALLFLQLSFYALALPGYLSGGENRCNLFKIPYFFVTVNLSILYAWAKYIRGERFRIWQPSER
ncbi:MAG TPA: glycosyltransferase family 2 protein [Proteobacteria bacterium]|nr:glycosyltransferase family 2 protein [Pseudomonadota bacterium]